MGTLLSSTRVSTLRRPSYMNLANKSASNDAPSNIATSTGSTGASTLSPPAGPIHPNSHAANLKDPNRLETSEITLDAMRQHHIADYVVDSIVNPVPYGEEGDFYGAAQDYEEQAIKLVYTYTVTFSTELAIQQKNALSGYLGILERKNDMPYLLDSLGLSSQEYRSLVKRVNQ